MSEDTAVISAEYAIAEIEPKTVQDTMVKINKMRSMVQKNLTEGHDFGKIPGCPKPSLFKPGAEKILILFGLTSEYEIIDKVQDYEKGFFAFTVRCFLSRNGLPVTQGVGHCNTKERKYQRGNPYDLANTVLKMAKKRAQVDATLTVASLSDIFTQDVEDMDLEPPKPAMPKPPTIREQFDALKAEYVEVCGNVPHALNAMKKVATRDGFDKITPEYIDALREDLLLRKHVTEDGGA